MLLFSVGGAFAGSGDLAPDIGATAVGMLTCHIPYGAAVKVVTGGMADLAGVVRKVLAGASALMDGVFFDLFAGAGLSEFSEPGFTRGCALEAAEALAIARGCAGESAGGLAETEGFRPFCLVVSGPGAGAGVSGEGGEGGSGVVIRPCCGAAGDATQFEKRSSGSIRCSMMAG